MEVAKVTSKGQITIPISIRRKLDINEGDKVLFIYKPEGVLMVNPNTYQGVVTDDADVETAAEAPAVKSKKQASAAPKAAAVPAAAPEAAKAIPDEPAAEVTASPAEVRRPVPPPVEEPEKPEAKVAGLDLSSLLDDIRSTGSNI